MQSFSDSSTNKGAAPVIQQQSSGNVEIMATASAVMNNLSVMFSNASNSDKTKSQHALEEFQKQTEAWQVCFALLKNQEVPVEPKLFAAQTLKAKLNYDLHQLDMEKLEQVKEELVGILLKFPNVPKPVKTQIIVAVAALALQIPTWNDPLRFFAERCSANEDQSRLFLQFISVIPEEVHDARKSFITEDELLVKEQELLTNNSSTMLEAVQTFANRYGTRHAVIFECLNSWLSEVNIMSILQSPLLDMTFEALNSEELFPASSELIASLIAETRDVDTDMRAIEILYPRVLMLESALEKSIEDSERFMGYARIIAEAAESWVVLAARIPEQFLQLVKLVMKLCKLDDTLDVIQYTFEFWLDLRRFLTLPAHSAAREKYASCFLELAQVIIDHLRYPKRDENGNDDVFEGDRELEDKFRSFRHEMGDVLKDCCVVVGYSRCLSLAFGLIKSCLERKANGIPVPWQDIEAPLFSLRAMAREIPTDETNILPELINIILKLDDHDKIRYSAMLVVGRYTEWTARHPEFMTVQLNYMIAGLSCSNPSIRVAAAQSFKHLCQDCNSLLSSQIDTILDFYRQIFVHLDPESVWQVTEGVCAVIESQPRDKLAPTLKEYLDIPVQHIIKLIKQDQGQNLAPEFLQSIAQSFENIAIFAQCVAPRYDNTLDDKPEIQEQPCIPIFNGLMDLCTYLLSQYQSEVMICEKVCKFFKNVLRNYRESAIQLLPILAEILVKCFEQNHFGCFLWISGCCIQEFGRCDEQTRSALWKFTERQSHSFFEHLAAASCKEIPDGILSLYLHYFLTTLTVVEDFFRFMQDVTVSFPFELVRSELADTSIRAAVSCLSLEQLEPLWATLNFLADFFAYGYERPPISMHDVIPEDVRAAVRNIQLQHGLDIMIAYFQGMIYSFPRDCYSEASGMIRPFLDLLPQESEYWISQTLDKLPSEFLKADEKQKFLKELHG